MQYISTTHQKALEQTYKTTVIIALVFCFTPLLFIGVGRFLKVSPGATVTMEQYVLLNKIAYGGALLAGLLVVGLRRFWTKVVLRTGKGQRSIPALLNQLRLWAIMSGVLGELVAILGFVAFSLSTDFQFCWRLGVVALLLILYSFPRRSEWERVIASQAQD